MYIYAQQRYVVRLTWCVYRSYFFFFFLIRVKSEYLCDHVVYIVNRFATWLDFFLVFFFFFFFYIYHHYAARLVTSVVTSAQMVIQPRRKRIQLYNETRKKERNKENTVWPCVLEKRRWTCMRVDSRYRVPRQFGLTCSQTAVGLYSIQYPVTGSFEINQNDSRVNSVKVWRSGQNEEAR